jgi:hypothetical protein
VPNTIGTQLYSAWFPEAIAILCTHPSDRIWAGSVGSYLCLFMLEGGEHIERCG